MNAIGKTKLAYSLRGTFNGYGDLQWTSFGYVEVNLEDTRKIQAILIDVNVLVDCHSNQAADGLAVWGKIVNGDERPIDSRSDKAFEVFRVVFPAYTRYNPCC